MVDLLKQALPVFLHHQDSDDEILHQAMIAAGVPGGVAHIVLVFMPFAFTRVIIDGMGIRYRSTYRQLGADGRLLRFPFASQPVYKAAAELAKSGVSQEVLLAVAGRCAEFRLVNQMLSAGSSAKDLVLAEPIIDLPPNESQADGAPSTSFVVPVEGAVRENENVRQARRLDSLLRWFRKRN